MAPRTSAPQPISPGLPRRSKNEQMRQWRRRGGVLGLLPGGVWSLWLLALVLDGTALAGGLLLSGAERCLPAPIRRWITSPRLEAWRPDVSDVYLTGEGQAGLIGLGAVVCLMLSLNFRARFRRLAGGLYGLGWLGLLASLILGGWAVAGRFHLDGAGPFAGVDDFLYLVGLLTLVLGMLLEGWTQRGWCLLATGLAGGLLLLGGVAWPDTDPVRLAVGGHGSRLGMLLPGLLMLAGYAALAMGWMLGVLGLACVLARPGRGEPLGSVVFFAGRCLQIGLTLMAGALVLDGSWGGQAWSGLWSCQSHEVWAVAPMLVAALVLLCRAHGNLSAPGLAILIVAAFSGLVIVWSACHASVGMIALAGWVGLVNLCLALHACQRYLSYRPVT